MALYKEHFGKEIYWKERYEKQQQLFEWYHPFKHLRDIITQYSADYKTSKVLYAGCGTSKVPEDLYNLGFRNIVSIDSSKDCVEFMRKQYNDTLPKTFLFLQMNVKDMHFGDGIFNYVIDKGMLDSLASGYQSTEQIGRYIKEVLRVLDEHGIFFCMSFRPPTDRFRFLKEGREHFEKIKVHKIYRPKFEHEINFIRKEHVSKEVIKDMEENFAMSINEDQLANYQDDVEADIFNNLVKKEKEDKEAKEKNKGGLGQPPKDVDTYYMYVCIKKEKVVPKAESERDDSEDYDDEEAGEEEEVQGEEENKGEHGQKSMSGSQVHNNSQDNAIGDDEEN